VEHRVSLTWEEEYCDRYGHAHDNAFEKSIIQLLTVAPWGLSSASSQLCGRWIKACIVEQFLVLPNCKMSM